jgi:hypothetical protein
MKKSKSLFGRLNNEIRRSSADKATAFHRSSLREKALPKNACWPNSLRNLRNQRQKICVNLCESMKSVSNFPLCLGALVAEIQSIKTTKLCETNPISEMPKMNLNHCKREDYGNKSAPLTMEKQSQTNPIQSQFRPKQSQNKPNQTQSCLPLAGLSASGGLVRRSISEGGVKMA